MQAKDIDVPEGKQIIDIVTNNFTLDDGKKVRITTKELRTLKKDQKVEA